MSVRPPVLAGCAVAALAVSGCGAGGDNGAVNTGPPPAGGSGRKLSLRADPGGQLRFDKKTLKAAAGQVAIVMSNPSALSHNVSIQGNGVARQGETVPQGGTSKVSARLRPGTYTFYCSVPGHRQAGMFGTLTVK